MHEAIDYGNGNRRQENYFLLLFVIDLNFKFSCLLVNELNLQCFPTTKLRIPLDQSYQAVVAGL